MEIKVIDALGMTRYDLYRASKDGVVNVTLPLAANDPAGGWKVVVTELLDYHAGSADFVYRPAGECGALAGATPRAVYFGDDRRKIFDFARRNSIVTIAVGSSPYDSVAAQRLVDSLKPWGVTATVVDASKVETNPVTSADQAVDTLGFWQGHRAKVGTDNDPIAVGYDIAGGAILIGNPTDNPLIKFEQDNGFFAYNVTGDFPGRGRGYIGWQTDALGNGKESITLIAQDAAGMDEASGTAYECIAGMNPLTALGPPIVATVKPASVSTVAAPPAPIAWTAILPDRATSVINVGASAQFYTLDGTLNTIDSAGKVTSSVPEEAPASAKAPAGPTVPPGKLDQYKIVKQVLAGRNGAAVAYWGGEIETFDAKWNLKTAQLMSADVSCLTWLGPRLVAGLSDGRVVALDVK